MFLTSFMGNNLFNKYMLTLVHRLHTLGPGLPNLHKVDNMATGINLLTMLATLTPDAGLHVLHEGPG